MLALSSGSFLVALNHASVANVLFFQALAPILAAAMGSFLGDPVSRRTWLAMAIAVAGVAVMVGGPGRPSLLGQGLSLVVSVSFAATLVITRHRRDVSMAPATCLSQLLVLAVAAPFIAPSAAGALDVTLLAALGITQIGLGFVFLTIGGRLIPAGEVALITLLEIVLGPLWVWVFLGERPSTATLVGGAIVLARGAARGAHAAGVGAAGRLAERRNRRAVFGVRLRALDERVLRELVAHRLAQHAGAAAVHDSHLAEPRERSLVDELPRLEPRFMRGAAAHVDLVRHVTSRGGANLHDRRAFLRRALARRTQPSKGNAHTLPGGADDLGIVAADRGDRPAHTDVGRLDRVSFGQRRRRLQRLDVVLTQHELGFRGPVGRGSEGPVLIGVATGAARRPHITAKRGDLGTGIRELALHLGDRLRARLLRRGAHALDLTLELRLARGDAPSRLLHLRAPLTRRALRRLRLGDELRRPQAFRGDTRTGVADDRRVEPEPLGDAKCMRGARAGRARAGTAACPPPRRSRWPRS